MGDVVDFVCEDVGKFVVVEDFEQFVGDVDCVVFGVVYGKGVWQLVWDVIKCWGVWQVGVVCEFGKCCDEIGGFVFCQMLGVIG